MNSLDDFDSEVRRKELERLLNEEGVPADFVPEFNLHAHTFFSYNAEGYSPSRFAWMARKAGHEFGGIVDFDVLDALDEFYAAGKFLGLKTCASIESRVFVPEFSDRVINSPGEPGVAYHMGVGFPSRTLPPEAETFLQGMLKRTGDRNREVIRRVNTVTGSVQLDYDADVLPLTPNGNATERHICLAYANKAAAQFPDLKDLTAYWSDCLGGLDELPDGPTGGGTQALIRSKLMKQGGVGYIQSNADSFPVMKDMNEFVLASGAIPTLAWLDGTSDGEQCMDELLDVAMGLGVAAFALIPDRNFTPGVQDQKLANLYEVIQKVEARDLPVIIGTELNAPGQKFVDDFDSEELKPLIPCFRKGACIAYAHVVFQREAGMGYLSEWAATQFSSAAEKNEFYHEVGRCLAPDQEAALELNNEMKPSDILAGLERNIPA